MPLERVRRTTLVDAVISHIRHEIVTGTWKVGARIPTETELVATLEVARTTLREAIRALAHTGMLEVRHGDGTYVRAVSEFGGAVARRVADADGDDALRLRRLLAAEAARLAATRPAAEEELARMEGLLAERAAAWRDRDRQGWLTAEIGFHQAVADASGNALLAELVTGLSRPLRAALDAEWASPAADGAGRGGHHNLLAAIGAHDAARAVAESAGHLGGDARARGDDVPA